MSTEPAHQPRHEPSPTGPDFLGLVERNEPGEVVETYDSEIVSSLRSGIDGSIDIAWIQGQSCSGCTMSFLQSDAPAIEETLGVDERGNPKPVLDWVIELGERADVVIAAGSCAAFGGLPAAGRYDSDDVGESPTGARGLQFDGQEAGGVFGPTFTSDREIPVVNVAGCPLYAEHLILTLGTLLNGHSVALDEFNRPLPLFGPLVHDDCELREEYECFDFAAEPGDDGCLYDVGCAGVYANCDGSMRLRNGGTTVCRNVGAPCIGCVEPAFWDRFSPFYRNTRDDDGTGAADPPASAEATATSPSDGISLSGMLSAVPQSPIGVALACMVAVVLAPLAPLAPLVWLYERRTDSGPISWSTGRPSGSH